MASAPASSTSALPGTKFFAPQVRIVTQAGEALQIDGQPIGQDVISVTLTQPCSGVGQCEITLNNQRFDRAGSYKIFTPAWRYNSLKSNEIAFGSRLRVDMRYGQDGWTPMMLVRVTDIAFSFPSGAGASLTLKCEDMLSLLKIKPNSDSGSADPQSEEDQVEEKIYGSGCGLEFDVSDEGHLFSTHLRAHHFRRLISSSVSISRSRSARRRLSFPFSDSSPRKRLTSTGSSVPK